MDGHDLNDLNDFDDGNECIGLLPSVAHWPTLKEELSEIQKDTNQTAWVIAGMIDKGYSGKALPYLRAAESAYREAARNLHHAKGMLL